MTPHRSNSARRPEGTTTDDSDLGALLEMGEVLSSTLDLRSALQTVLEKLERHHRVIRSAVTLLHEDTGEIAIEAALGIAREAQSTRYRVGEGITGRVVQSGRPIVVPKVSQEPLFLNRATDRRGGPGHEVTFICVPLLFGKDAIGALSVDLEFDPARAYESTVRFLGVVASMIAQSARMHRLVQAERQRLVEENSHLRQELIERYDFSNIVGTSGAMRALYGSISQVARSNTTVLIRGESGTGKELIAHAIHYNSKRAKRPFVKVSCAALPETLIESELFGYEKGAFTGAQTRKKGRFELAEGGTLFLDEVGEINVATQVKLLRVLQEREFERLGGTETVKVDVRVIAATNRPLEDAIAARAFREDLYYRLNVFTICVPPLRDRRSDIMLLADRFLEQYAREHGKCIKRIATPAIDMLTSYHWPGNVRELENAISRAVLVCDGSVVHGHHLPPTLQTAEASGTLTSTSLTVAVEQLERDLIIDALKTTRGNQSKAARLLQTTERILGYKVRSYGIGRERFQAPRERLT